MMRIKILIRIGLILVSFLVAFLLLEAGLRVSGWYIQSPVYVEDDETGLPLLKLSSKMKVKSECFENEVVTNRYGFHGPDYEKVKPEGTYRIAIMGDSFVEAAQVPLEKTFSSILERKLNQDSDQGLKYEVIPFGISSHGTYASLLYFKYYAAEFKPDLVINLYSYNDLTDDLLYGSLPFDEKGEVIVNISGQEPDLISKIKKGTKSQIRKSVAVMTLRRKLKQLEQKEQIGSVPELPEQVSLDQLWPDEEKIIIAFRDLVRASGADFLFISGTEASQVHPELAGTGEKADNFGAEDERLADIAQKLSMRYLSLASTFKGNAEKTKLISVWPCDGHWNQTGHEWAAEAIYEKLF